MSLVHGFFGIETGVANGNVAAVGSGDLDTVFLGDAAAFYGAEAGVVGGEPAPILPDRYIRGGGAGGTHKAKKGRRGLVVVPVSRSLDREKTVELSIAPPSPQTSSAPKTLKKRTSRSLELFEKQELARLALQAKRKREEETVMRLIQAALEEDLL